MCLLRYLRHTPHHPTRITKANKSFARELSFKVIQFPVKVRGIEERILLPLMFRRLCFRHYLWRLCFRHYVSKKCYEEKHVY